MPETNGNETPVSHKHIERTGMKFFEVAEAAAYSTPLSGQKISNSKYKTTEQFFRYIAKIALIQPTQLRK